METKDKIIAGSACAIMGFSLLGGCPKSDKNEAVNKWENSHGTQGFINLNAVRDAFKSNQSMPEFEKRVNEIFEGDNMVVFEAKEVREGFKIEASEDLDGNKRVTNGDDLLFTLQVKGRIATLQGAGVNKYYKESWLFELPPEAQRTEVVHHHSSMSTSPFFWWWVMSPGWHGYYTPRDRYMDIRTHRNVYRESDAYVGQTTQNGSFGKSMENKHGSRYRSAVNQPSSKRTSYIKKQTSNSAFRNRLAASNKKNGSVQKSQMRSRTSASKSKSFSGRSRSGSSSGRSYGGFRGSSGFEI